MSEFRLTLTLGQAEKILLDMLARELQNEPPDNAGGHPSTEMHEVVGRRYKEWEDRVHGLRIVLSYRLTTAAIDAAMKDSNGNLE